MLASSMPPTPSVLALVGACSRMKKSRKRSRPMAPTSAKLPPTTSSEGDGELEHGMQGGGVHRAHSMTSPRAMKRASATVATNPSSAITSAASNSRSLRQPQAQQDRPAPRC